MEIKKPTLHFQRFEFKYYLPKATADKLIPALRNHMDWDEYIKDLGRNFYLVNSLYYDSSSFGCFWDKESGVVYRKKLRIRFYGEEIRPDTDIFIEIKRKSNAIVIKDRIRIKASDFLSQGLAPKLTELLKENPDSEFLKEVFWFVVRNSMKPKLSVFYKRRALIGRNDKRFRITFDYDIKSKLSNKLENRCGRMKDVYPGGVILEVKYNNVLPSWFHRIIQKYQLQILAYSKYCNALRTVVPQFDDNNYKVI